MQMLPLLSNAALDASIAMRGNERVTTAAFVAQAEALARQLPGEQYLINLVENRYHFLLGWVAACLRNQVTVLPPNQTAATLAELRREYPSHHVFDDDAAERLVKPAEHSAATLPAWAVPIDRVMAIVFTSGTTGRPQAHPKAWGSLFHNSRLAARDVLGGLARNIVATVPSQHMYGLEASLLGSLTAGCCLFDRKPFFPADVRAALAALPEPRTLVTTPAHLRILAAADMALPRVHRVVSATAPLLVELARQIEQRWQTEVFEIYGCTEAGVIAHRRTTESTRWRTLAGGTMANADGAAEYRAPQLRGATPLPDVIELHRDTQFTLLGRASDMVKVAGKRSSLQELTRQVLSVPGVEDAAVLVPDGGERLTAAVVAPGFTASHLLAALRQIMEPVFVPRPLVLVDRLPHNELGKLPRDALLDSLRSVDMTGVIRIPAEHPSLAGHFPGDPLVPGVVLLDAVLAHIRERRSGAISSLPSVKFLSAVRPKETIRLRLEFNDTSVRFTGLREATPVFEGSFVFSDVDPI
jgi:acyl-coenzyme A synthetase/AMP-(fatty) acid ligase